MIAIAVSSSLVAIKPGELETHSFVLALAKEDIAEGVRSRSVSLVGLESAFNQFCAGHNLMGAFGFRQ